MKRFLLILVVLILIVGCSQNGDSTTFSSTPPPLDLTDPDITVPPSSSSEPIEIVMVTGNATTGLDIADYIFYWNKYLKEKFNIDIKFEFYGKLQGYTYTWYPTLLKTDLFTYNTGVVFSDNIAPYIRDNIIQPFTDYVGASENWASLPDAFRNAYRDTSGNIWAIPYSEHITVFGRAINKEWLSTLDIEAPGSTEELYQMLQRFTYEDPDGNDKDDTYGTALSGMYMRWLNFKDVFEANGCYLTYEYSFDDNGKTISTVVPVGYNPKTNKIEDSVIKPEMKESLTFISSLIENKIICPNYNYMNGENFTNSKVGSYMGPVQNNIIYPDKYEYVFSLQGLMSEYTSSIFQDGEGAYFLSANSKNPEEVVPRFIDTFYVNKEGYKFARFGLLGDKYMYSENNGYIQANYPAGSLISDIRLVGDVSWQKVNVFGGNLDSSKVELDIENLKNNNNIFLLTQNQMAFGEKILLPLKETEPSIIYFGEISRAYYNFEMGMVGVEDTYNELLRIHNIYNVALWIDEINEKWIGGN